MRLNSFTTIGGLAGGSGGAAAGFAIGSVVMPGVGSIVGAVVGGLAGGILGEQVSGKAYKVLEDKIKEAKEVKSISLQIEKDARACGVTLERYHEALGFLAVPMSNPTLTELEECYLKRLEDISRVKEREEERKEERQKIWVEKYEIVIEAFEDCKKYTEYHLSKTPS